MELIIFIVLVLVAVYVGGSGLLWLLLVLVFADLALLILTLVKRLKKQENKELIPPLDQTFEMSGWDFEEYVAKVYKQNGYKIINTKKSCDQGIDIIVKRVFSTGIQAKCYNRPVGNRAVQEAAAGRKYYRLKKAVVVTNSIFTRSAYQLAQKNKIKLIDRRSLAKMVAKANGAKKSTSQK